MRVQRVLMPGSEAESWTLLGDDQVPVEPAEQFLGYLSAVERSPNTVKAYAHDLKDWFAYLAGHGLDWRAVTAEDVAGFVAWLRLPPAARCGTVAVLPTVAHHCAASSVNRKLAALASFCEFHARRGVPLAGLLAVMQPAGRGRPGATSYKPFLQHVAKGRPQRRRTVKLAAPSRAPQVLTARQAQAILDACGHLRDRLLFALLLDCGVRIGEALGTRHEDMMIAERQVAVAPRDNDNRARVKAGRSRIIPASAGLFRLYADYLAREYGALDSDYVFVNLWAAPYGHPLAYPAVYDLVGRLRKITGIAFSPHLFRHTYATWLQGRGVASDATFRAWREDGAVRVGGLGTAGWRSRRQSEPAGQDGCDRTVLRQMPGCCAHSGCIRRKYDAARTTKNRSDEGRCHHRPLVTLTHSTWLVIRSLPV